MKERLLFIYNPNAGKGKIRSKLSSIIELFSGYGFEVIVFPTTKKLDAREIVKDYVKQNRCDRIVCAGGDGTLNEVAGGLMLIDKVVPIGYIPSGTTNDFGYSLRLPRNLLVAAELAATGSVFYCDIASINGIFFTYTASFGLFSDVSYETPQNMKNILGRSAYILSGISKIASIKPYKIRVEFEDQVIEDEFLLGMLANADSVGGFRGLTGKDVMYDDGFFEMLLIRMPRNVIEINSIIYELLKGEFDAKYVIYQRVSKVHISSEDSLPWSLDGEDGGDINNAEIIVHKQAIPYICRGVNLSLEEENEILVERDLIEQKVGFKAEVDEENHDFSIP